MQEQNISMQTYKEVINQFVCEILFYDRAQLTPTKYLVKDLLADSVSLIDLMATISDHFNIKLSSQDLLAIETVADLYELVAKYQYEAIP